jgi:glutamate carboxypeptidase
METTDGVMRLFENLKECAADCGYGSIHPISVGGISDSSITVVCGVPTVCGMGCKGIGNHTSDEYADVESLFERSVLAACAVYGLNLD